MKKINFKLIKDNKIIINENNINCIIIDNKMQFIIEGIKYTYDNNIFIRETKEEIIKLNFNSELCTITLKEYNQSVNINIKVMYIEKKDNLINIEYKIETEENIINIISIEYV